MAASMTVTNVVLRAIYHQNFSSNDTSRMLHS